MGESVRPDGTPALAADGSGLRITMSWQRWLAAVMVLLGSTGGYAGYQLVTRSELTQAISNSETKQSRSLDTLRQRVQKNGKELQAVTVKIGQVQEVQHMDIAITESRRVVDEAIKCGRYHKACLERRDNERERVRRLNMRRLSKGLPPCPDLECE